MAVRAGRADLLQPVVAGVLAAVVGFASTFTVLLSGMKAAGVGAPEAASGLLATCVVQGLMSVALSLWWRQPVSVVWSTPGYALLLATGVVAGGAPAVAGATIVAAGLIVVAGLVRPFGRLVGAIPPGLASAMLAGILFEICLAPVEAAKANPALILPVVLAWALALRFARRYAVPVAVAVTALLVATVTRVPPGSFVGTAPMLVPTLPVFRWDLVVSLAVPLFVVTMASQNIPGLTVLRANGYRPRLSAIFACTGLASVVTALCGGGLVNLAAITAALCAGPEAHPDPARRYWSTVASGVTYVGLGLCAALAAAFVAAAPPDIVQAVAGLALLGTLAGALAGALAPEGDRLPVAVTFVVTASGLSLFGIGASFWGLLAGGVLMGIERLPGRRAVAAQSPGLEAARK